MPKKKFGMMKWPNGTNSTTPNLKNPKPVKEPKDPLLPPKKVREKKWEKKLKNLIKKKKDPNL